jgi:ribosomal protein L12E/L44/L45/RPP1/RPP2
MNRTDLEARHALLVATASVQRLRVNLEARALHGRSMDLLQKGHQGAWVATAAAVAAATFVALRGRSTNSLGVASSSDAGARGAATLPGALRALGSVLALWRAWRTWRGGRAGRASAP